MLFDPIDAPLCLWVLHQLREEFKFKYENRVFLLHPVFGVYWSIKTVYKSVKFTLFPQKRRTLDPVFSAHMPFIGYVQTPPRNKHSIPT